MEMSHYKLIMKAKLLGYDDLFDLYSETRTLTHKAFSNLHKGVSVVVAGRILRAVRRVYGR